MRTFASVKRMFAVLALYAARLVEPRSPAPMKRLPPAPKTLLLRTGAKE